MTRDALKFGLVGGISTAIDFLFLNFFTFLGLNIFWAIFFSYLLGSVNGYLLNNKWTYGHLEMPSTVSGFLQYATVSFIGLGLTELIVYAFYSELHLGVNASKLLAVAIVFFWNFLANRMFTFKVKPPLVV
ncbi:MAG: GtrA family protein [bacterium]